MAPMEMNLGKEISIADLLIRIEECKESLQLRTNMEYGHPDGFRPASVGRGAASYARDDLGTTDP